jgi:hypothetical protein
MKSTPSKRNFFNLPNKYKPLFDKLNSPKKVQDYLDTLEMNFEEDGETYYSPLMVLEKKRAHCIEGAMLAALIFWYHGGEPLIMDFETAHNDFDHIVAPFRVDGHWGAISKTNHSVLRYREAIYKTPRELALSYFNEYFLDKDGTKTLRTYSDPVNLKIFNKNNWITTRENLFCIPEYLAGIKHNKILTQKQIRNLRKADKIEVEASKVTEWKQIKGTHPKKVL